MVKQIKAADESIDKAKLSLSLWDEISIVHTQRDGLDFQTAKDLITSTKNTYNIIDLEVDMSVPKLLKNSTLNKYTNVEVAILNLKFYTLTDYHAFKFINDIMNNISGDIQIEKMEFKVLKDVDEQLIQKINSGEIKTLIYTEVTFKWQNIIETKQNVG